MVDDSPTTSRHTRLDRWRHKANENVEKWGLQDQPLLLLAIQEELGELTQAYLESEYEDGDEWDIHGELDDLAALLVQYHDRLAANMEEPDE